MSVRCVEGADKIVRPYGGIYGGKPSIQQDARYMIQEII